MGKILNATRVDETVVLTVQLSSGAKEKWTYIKEDNNFLQVDRQDTK